jgi:hypothetical protein
MNVFSMNIQSLRNKLTDFTTFVQQTPLKFHVIVLSETHLRQNELSHFNLPGYAAEHCVRESGRFGGVSIFVRKDFSPFNLIHKLDVEMNNSLLIKLLNFDIHIAAFYHCRDSIFDNFLDRLDFVLDNYSNCYVFGDFNIDMCKLSSDSKVKAYHDLVQANGFIFLNSFSSDMATRVDTRRNTATCIDHILTDAIFYSQNLTFTVSIDELFGDHKSLLLSVYDPDETSCTLKNFYNVKCVDHAKIISQNLLSSLSTSNFSSFESQLKSVMDDNTKILRFKERFNKPFMNLQTLNFITIKNNYFKLLRKYPQCVKVQERFKYYRNLVTKKVTMLKKDFYHKKFQKCADNPKETWRNINNILRNTDSNSSCSIQSIRINDIVVNNQSQIVDGFNHYFVDSVDEIHNSLSIDLNVCETIYASEYYHISHPFDLSLSTPQEILDILSSLSSSNAEDRNGFSNALFKKYKLALHEHLATLINAYLHDNLFPDCIKTAKVSPLFKTGDKTLLKNYRPIAILPICSKIFEGVLLNRIEEHLSSNELLCKYQFGYTKKSSCESAVLHVMNQIYQNLENKQVTAALFIDLTKAFDCLHHPLLLLKLRKMGFSENFLTLMTSYLSNRFQYVQLENTTSSLVPITKGVFQGSKLAATLFIIYINSIFNLPLNGKLFLYADDITIVYKANDRNDLKLRMEYDLQVLDIWLTCHYMRMNTAKTNYILFHGKTRLDYFTQNALNIKLNDQLINRVDCFKYLGLWIDEELNFHRHVEHVKSKIIPMTFAIRRIRPVISQNTALRLYFAHIYPHLLYMNPFWNIVSDNYMKILAVAQRKCLRFIYNRYSFSPSSELFSESILPLEKLNEYNNLLLAFKISKNLLVNNTDLTLVGDRRSYNTRQNNHFYVENYRTRFGFANFFTRGLIAYNSLDARLKNIHFIGRFKRELKHLLLNEYLEQRN